MYVYLSILCRGGGSYKKNEGEDQIFSPTKEGRWIELSKRFNK